MFQQRYRVFKQRLGWSVADCDGAERDAFDEASPIYLLAYNSDGRLAGSWRFLPTTGPYMLRDVFPALLHRSEEHTSELQSLMRNSYAVFCLKKKTFKHKPTI